MRDLVCLFFPELELMTEEELAYMKVKATLEAQMQFKRERLGFSVRKNCLGVST